MGLEWCRVGGFRVVMWGLGVMGGGVELGGLGGYRVGGFKGGCRAGFLRMVVWGLGGVKLGSLGGAELVV